jgi:hypothetical protein
MLDRVVSYLRSHGVSFRLSSYPSPEPLPPVLQPISPGGLMVETCVIMAGGRPAIACLPRGTQLSLVRLTHELGVDVIEGTSADLAPPYKDADGPLPPLGGALGTLVVIDEKVSLASTIAFPAFSSTDILEIPYEEFSRLERPRIASFGIGGELPERAADETGTERRVA